MKITDSARPEWIGRGKTVRELIKELQSFEDQNLPVLLSQDGGETTREISLVMRIGSACVLANFNDE